MNRRPTPPRILRDFKAWLSRAYGRVGADWSADQEPAFRAGFRAGQNYEKTKEIP